MARVTIEQLQAEAERLARDWVTALIADSPEIAVALVPMTVDQQVWLEAGALYALRSLANPAVPGSGPMMLALARLRSRMEGL